MNSETINRAAEIWSYMSADAVRVESDCIVVCCSYDLRVCDHACELISAGYSDRLLLSGNSGNWTRHLWCEPEAEIFHARALANGISPEQIIIETEATNFGENIKYSRALLGDIKSVTLVSKPNSLLRVKLTAAVQWPQVDTYLSCPDIRFPDEVSNIIGVLGVINEMVGDVERIQVYPESGFQLAHELPESIIESWNYLVGQGFTEHLLQRKTTGVSQKT